MLGPSANLRTSAECVVELTERFDRSDRAAHDAAYYTTDRIPAAHLETAECATGDAEQDVTHWML